MTRLEETDAPAIRLAATAEGEAARNPLRGMKLYHGTTSSRARKILNEGLRPRGEGRGNYSPHLASHQGCVYLSTVYGPAYACRAIPRLGPLAVVEIDAGVLRADRLRPDEDCMLQCILPPNMAAVGAERGVLMMRNIRSCLCPPRQPEGRATTMTDHEMLQYRQEHFAVEIRDADWPKDTVSLSVTLNGDQWTTLSLRPDEMRQVYEAIGAYLAAQETAE